MSDAAAGTLHLVVAGHTNTGKTSLLRTLARDSHFGEVSASPSTTRQVQSLQLVDRPGLQVTVDDTPGLERAGALREHMDALGGGRHERRTQVDAVLAARPSAFEQELRVLQRVLDCDAALYVIDAREPVLEKYLDEIEVLALCGRPVIPLLNFVAWPESREAEWRRRLGEQGLHVVAAFDAVVYDWQAERALYEDLRRMLPQARAPIDALIELRQEEIDWRPRAAARLLAESLIDLAAARATAQVDDEASITEARRRLRDLAREREKHLLGELLRLFSYDPELVELSLPVDPDGGAWVQDLFSLRALQDYGIRSAGPVAAGVAAGAAVDLAALGTTLGAGLFVGALAGAAVGTRKAITRGLDRRLRGIEVVQLDDATLQLMASRNLRLVSALGRRGHASQASLSADADVKPPWRGLLPGPLRQARDRPDWCMPGVLEASPFPDVRRARAVRKLSAVLGPGEAPTRPQSGVR